MSITSEDLEAIVEGNGQAVLFDGMRVQRIRNKLTGIKDWDSLFDGDRVELRDGDTGTITLDWFVEKVEGYAKHDAAGHATGPFTRTQILRVFDGSVEVTALTRREDRPQ